ncbi:MAG: type II secretion system F family protein [Candidatus Zixiibacteriota bacterium]
MLLTIAIFVFAAVFCATVAIYLILQHRLSWQSRAIKERLQNLSESSTQSSQAASILRQEDRLSNIPALEKLLHKFSLGNHLKKLIVQAGARTNPGTVVLAMGSLGMLAFLIAHFVTRGVFISVATAVGPAVLPYVYLHYKRVRRLRDFEEELPEALDMIVNGLRSGFTFELALKMVAQELPDPLAYEFAVVFEEQNLGVPLQDALAGLRYRVPSDDLDLLIISLVLHRRTGGNLAEVLEKTAGTIRDRFRLKREVRTKTAHGRFSGFVLVMMPIAMTAILMTLAPDYFLTLLRDKAGQFLLASAIVMQIVGILVIRKIIDIKY